MILELGIDEAGRGPVIGDMFVVGVIIDSNVEERLRVHGVKDSKLLTPKRRAELFKLILREASLIISLRYSPQIIDRENINKLFIEASNYIVRTVLKLGIGKHVKRIVVDAVSRNELIYKLTNLLRSMGREDIELIVENKADRKYVVVSAASIIAKVLRDTHIDALHRIYGDFGSGYPSDPRTIAWLRNFVGVRKLPPIIRTTWSTLVRLGISTEGKTSLLKWLKRESNEG